MIIWVGVPLAARGEITVWASSPNSIMYLLRLIWPLIAIGYVVNLYQRGTASWNRMQAIATINPAIADAPGVRRSRQSSGASNFAI